MCNITAKSCTVRYEVPADEGDAPVTGYRVQRLIVIAGYEDHWETINKKPVRPTDLELVVDDLKPATQYQFRVAAENTIGAGDFGPPSQRVKSLPEEELRSPRTLQRYIAQHKSHTHTGFDEVHLA